MERHRFASLTTTLGAFALATAFAFAPGCNCGGGGGGPGDGGTTLPPVSVGDLEDTWALSLNDGQQQRWGIAIAPFAGDKHHDLVGAGGR